MTKTEVVQHIKELHNPKCVYQHNYKRYSADEMIDEINRDTELGKYFVKTFIELKAIIKNVPN